ncbi:3-oxoacyl-[acyl-carrier protein] reductase [Serinicoccus hydrothermalis]|jgi:3-oxoacyl-[acyl-carrier protein] reductase|uniref:3-oxoacyl-[acyl-carrier protein] reductase n=1 Tax=Serinicoccus hydrothermalis TaxID=1758689 RepID=A0A1B1NF94_9MICO|nr:3-oxoacyl-ACP reductase FabG [Serinicoccus hydrothermalis]ANS80073.1 3-oxoacyl-[acyl-carrier protein] reductase [Serinicoccus hydrothermalis]
MSEGKLQDRVAVVTGAGQGIGEGVARLYAAEGAQVAVVDINQEAAQAVADSIVADGGQAVAVVCDVGNRASVDEAAATVVEQLGVIDILVSNAGVTRPAMLWKMTDDEWNMVLDTHLGGSFYWLQAVAGGMREQKYGRIIFTTSAAGIIGTIGQINYSVAKAGLLGMTRSAARELADSKITVNAIAPAASTPMTEVIRTDERFKDTYLQSIPLKRWAEPDEVAASYLFLATEEAGYLTGQCLSVDGGRVMVR